MAEQDRTLTVAQVNDLSDTELVAALGAVFEGTPAIAAAAAASRPFADRAALIEAFDRAAGGLDDDAVLELLRAHPVLGDRGPMARSSQQEQASAGLRDLEAERLDQLAADNRRYLDRFGFPFIIAVRGLGPDAIARALADRLDHDLDAERDEAFTQVRRIAALRLEQQVRP
ncbi:2-oxo-4-hydroxy-4-carboxy-5-ureidoimidazoline decarboxylase [soil metagenome]